MNSTSERKLTELLIARAFFKLSSIPMEVSAAVISLTLVGTREIRMLRGSQTDPDTTALFWLELFDHSTRASIDSFRCDKIEDAAPIFEYMMFQATGLNGPDAGGNEKKAAMKDPDNDEDWIVAKKALEAACRLPGGKDRIEALKHAGRLRSYAVKKRLAKEAPQRGLNELPDTDPKKSPPA